MKYLLDKFEYLLEYDSFSYAVSFIITIAILSIPIFFAIKLVEWECKNYSEVTGRETKFVRLNCYVKYENTWYSRDEVSVVKVHQ